MLLIYLAITWILFLEEVVAETNITQKDELQVFYDALDGANWIYHDSPVPSRPVIKWNFFKDPCGKDCKNSFYGLTCHSANNSLCNVEQIQLQNCSLKGELFHVNFDKLSTLIALVLDNNFINGSIPSSLLRLSNLQVLGIGDNKLRYTLPLFSYQTSLHLFSSININLYSTFALLMNLKMQGDFIGGCFRPQRTTIAIFVPEHVGRANSMEHRRNDKYVPDIAQ